VTIPPDIHETVSRDLSIVIEKAMENFERQGQEAATLGHVRRAMQGGLLESLQQSELVRFPPERSLDSEIGGLIERWGEDALAVRFLRPRASQDLCTVIEAVMDAAADDRPPTLGAVRDAMSTGLLSALVGRGEIEDYDEQTLLEEIDALIERHGTDALAEEFLRYY